MLALLLAAVAALPPTSLTTVAERSGYLRTGRYEEVLRLCKEYARAYPKLVKCSDFGTTPEGRPMALLVVSNGAFDAALNRTQDRPVLLIQGGIHAGEIDGKDAGFWALRELLDRRDAAELFSKLTLLFVPVLNVDGHERFGANNRPNQRGPEEMGWRTTAQNFNLNRDYAKADAPETRAMLALLRDWDPVVYMDLHVTDGAQFQYDVALLIDPSEVGAEPLRAPGMKLRRDILDALAKQGHLGLPFYPSFIKDDDPSSGFEYGVAPIRFALGYWAVRSRLSILVETHSWKTYPKRVRVTHDAILALIDAAARDGASWKQAARAADEEAKGLGGRQDIPLAYENDGKSKIFEFRGYKYSRTLSPVSGRVRISYDETKPEIWKLPLFDTLKPALTAAAPRAGYVVPAAVAAWLAPRLTEHGIEFSVLGEARAKQELQVFRAEGVELKKESFEGRTPAVVKGAWKPEKVDVEKGALWVPIAQARARLILHLFEPASPDSYLSWGFFNAYFERKEYMEGYIAEAVAAEMLAKDPAVAREFQAKLESDADFAASPAKRLEFFYRRHASWDDRLGRYPIFRSDRDLATAAR